MSETIKSIGFALGMCLVCGVLLTAAATGLQPMQEKNRLSDRQKNVLYTVDLASRDKDYTPEQIRHIYEKNIDEIRVSAAGEIAEPAEKGAGQDGQVLTI